MTILGQKLAAAWMAVLAIFATGSVLAGTNIWTRLGPNGAIVSALAIDPLNSGIVYAATSAGLFKSTDEGASWSAVNPGPACCVSTLVINPQNPSTIYALTRVTDLSLDRRVLKSTDGGMNWSPVNSGLPVNADGLYGVTSLVIDPQNPDTLYAGNALAGGGVFKTTDGGEGWNPVNSGLPDGEVMALAIDPQNPGTIYASTPFGFPRKEAAGLFKSNDGGASWTAVNSGLVSPTDYNLDYISALAIDAKDPNIVYAAGDEEALFKTTDGGAHWLWVNFFFGHTVAALAIDPRSSGTVYAGTSAGVFKSIDGGTSWTAAETRLTNDPYGPLVIPALAIDPQYPDTLYAAGTYAGVFKTMDAGASWTAMNTELRATTPNGVIALAIDPQSPGTIYAGTDVGVFKTTDAGANWSAVNSGLPSDTFGRLNVSTLVIDSQNPSTIYAIHDSEIFKSTDGGANWISVNVWLRGARLWAAALAIDSQNSRTIYAGGTYYQNGQQTATNGVFKSGDGGTSWSAVSSGLPPSTINYTFLVTTVAIDLQNPGTVYAGTAVAQVLYPGSGIFKTTNGGGSWRNAGLPGFSVVDILAIDTKNPGTLFARAVIRSACCGSSWLFKTTNGGASWTEMDSGLPGSITALAIDPQNSSTIYAGSASGGFGRSSGGIFRSTDGGASWSAVNSGLTKLSVTTLAIDPQNPNTIYAGTAGGVFGITLVP